jgi:hypothetical protein
VLWNGNARVSTFVSPTVVDAAIPAVDLALVTTAQVSVSNPAPGGGVSNGLTFSVLVPNPVPVITSTSPPNLTAGTNGATLTVSGSGFVQASIVRWGLASLQTTYVDPNTLTAAVPAANLRYGGSITISVSNPAPGGGVSANLPFTIVGNPNPILNSVSPYSVVGGQAFQLTVVGSGFSAASIVQWNGQNLATTFVSATQLTANVPASDTASAGNNTVAVYNPPPGGGVSFYSPTVSITANGMPSISGLTPPAINAGAPDLLLTVTGQGFGQGSIVRWNGQDLPTTVTDRLQVTIPAALLATPGMAQITVYTPPLGGGVSAPVGFPIGIPLPAQDLVYDSVRGKLYASISSAASQYAGSVVTIDPASFSVDGPIAVGNNPGKLAISDDCSYLYVALNNSSIARIDLAAQKMDLNFPVLPSPNSGPNTIENMVVAPGAPHTIVIAHGAWGASVYDDGKLRGSRASISDAIDAITTSADPNTFYGFDQSTSGGDFVILQLSATGLSVSSDQRGVAIGGGRVIFSNGLVYNSNGVVFDPQAGGEKGRFSSSDSSSWVSVAPDSASGHVFFLGSGTVFGFGALWAFDQNAFVPLGKLTIPANASSLIRWGNTGLAFLTATQLVLFQSPFTSGAP